MPGSYPRDIVGYGRNPPEPKWPNQARLALQFVINYEEGGENCVLHGDVASEAFLSEIIGAEPLAGARHMNIESIYEYGSRAGFWRLHRLFTERSIPVTVYGVAMALERNPQAVAAMIEANWEIASMDTVGLTISILVRILSGSISRRRSQFIHGSQAIVLLAGTTDVTAPTPDD